MKKKMLKLNFKYVFQLREFNKMTYFYKFYINFYKIKKIICDL